MTLTNMLRAALQAHLIVYAMPVFGAYIGVDYLYWKAQENGLLYAISVPGGIPGGGGSQPGPGTFSAYFQNPHFTWNSGVRLYGGYAWCDTWSVEAIWTHYNNRHTTCIADPNGGIAAVDFFSTGNNSVNFGTQAQTLFALHFDTIDLAARGDGYIGQCLTLRPAVGLRIARINQCQSTLYSNVVFQTSDNVNVTSNATSARRNNFTAAGLYSDLHAAWALGHGVQLIGTAAAGLLGGKFCISTNLATNNAATVLNATLYDNKRRVRFFADFLLGFEWNKSLCNDAYELTLRAGYEMQWWPTQWQTITNLIQGIGGFPEADGDLTLQGLVVGLAIAF